MTAHIVDVSRRCIITHAVHPKPLKCEAENDMAVIEMLDYQNVKFELQPLSQQIWFLTDSLFGIDRAINVVLINACMFHTGNPVSKTSQGLKN